MEIATRTSSALSLRASSGINLTRERTTGLSLHGSRYDFMVEAIPSNGHFSFELRAIDRKSGRWSSIASVNHVMSELLGDGHDLCDVCWWYTPWDVSAEECVSLMTSAVQILIDEQTLARIERALDEDRAEGEWRAN